jgi:DNA-binding transcriptional LysR family regulator
MDWADRIGRRVKLRDLHVLLAVAQTGSMSKAAAQLAISHPVVSKTISELEHALGVRLLDRRPNGVEPTVYGREIINCSMAVFDELRQSVKRIEFLSDPTAGELRVGSTSPLMAGFVPSVVDHLTRKHPRVLVHAVQEAVPELHVALRDRRIDLAVARRSDLPLEQEFVAEKLFDERLFIVAGVQNPLTHRRNIKLADLIDEQWIMLPTQNPAEALLIEAFAKSGLPMPRAVVVSESGPLRNFLLATGRFLTVAAGSALHFTGRRLSLKILPIKLPVEPRPVDLIVLKNRTMAPVAQLFIEHARTAAKSMTYAWMRLGEKT